MKLSWVLGASLCFSLAACGGSSSGSDDGGTTSGSNEEGSSSGSDNVSSSSFESRYVGVWDFSDEEGDEWYLYIDADGNVSDFDYQGDAVDVGDNCYEVDENRAKFTAAGSGNYNYHHNFLELDVLVTLSLEEGDIYVTALEDVPEYDIAAGEKSLYAGGLANPPAVEDMRAMACR